VDRDIDRVMLLVRSHLPSVSIIQWHKKHPGDDDGVWWFRLPGVKRDIQLESSFGACPFVVEHDDMQSTAEQWRAATVEEAVDAVVAYLKSQLVRQDPVAEQNAAADRGNGY
jgi:hypothetical protein